MGSPPVKPLRVVGGRYAVHGEIASGGMASVHFGRLLGIGGFSRAVAIKQLHPRYAKDPEWVRMFLDEARLVTRIRHPNVVPTIDVVAAEGEVFLVMEYIPGETLSRVVRPLGERGERVPPKIACAIVAGVLHGLHAAHEAKDARGRPLGIVHRDLSPNNVLIGEDGVPRVLDFGLAKAAGRSHSSRSGEVKGTLAYMSPEQLNGGSVTRLSDVYAGGVLLWEALTGRRLFQADNEGALIQKVLAGRYEPASKLVFGIPPNVDEITRRALSKEPEKRFANAREMAAALDACMGAPMHTEISGWLAATAGAVLTERANAVASMERDVTEESIMKTLEELAEQENTLPNTVSELSGPPLQVYEGATTLSRPLDGSQRSTISLTTRTRAKESEHPSGAPPPLRSVLLLGAGAVAIAMGVGLTAARIRTRSLDVDVPLPASAMPAAAASVEGTPSGSTQEPPIADERRTDSALVAQPAPPTTGAPAIAEEPKQAPPAVRVKPKEPRDAEPTEPASPATTSTHAAPAPASAAPALTAPAPTAPAPTVTVPAPTAPAPAGAAPDAGLELGY